MDITVLKTELETDPLVRGYSGMTNQQAVDSLNTADRVVNIPSISGDETFAATDGTEFSALTDIKKQLWMAFCGRDSIDPFGSSNVAFVTFIFGGGSTSVSNLNTLRQQTVSRVTELGIGTVYLGHIEQARA